MRLLNLRILIPSFLIIIAFLAGCQKAPMNGDLDGLWQVMDVSPAPKDSVIKVRLYYSFYMHSCMLTFYGGGHPGSGNFIYNEDDLTIDFPYMTEEKDSIILSQYGINRNPVFFKIQLLNKNKMILRDQETIVTLRKF